MIFSTSNINSQLKLSYDCFLKNDCVFDCLVITNYLVHNVLQLYCMTSSDLLLVRRGDIVQYCRI